MTAKPVNWHSATVSAIRIALMDYEDILEYQTEYPLSKTPDHRHGHEQRIDLLVIKKLVDRQIPITIARIFKALNIFEIKGKGDTLGSDSYHKVVGYANQLIYYTGSKDEYTQNDITLSFITQSFPRKLFRYFKEMKTPDGNFQFTIEKFSEGIYYIYGGMFTTQLIVMSRLPPDEYSFMRCLCAPAKNGQLLKSVMDECVRNHDNAIYGTYSNELTNFSERKEADPIMTDIMTQAVFRLYHTSSEEIERKAIEKATKQATEKAQKEVQKEIDELNAKNQFLSGENSVLSDENKYLKQLLAKHGIAYN